MSAAAPLAGTADICRKYRFDACLLLTLNFCLKKLKHFLQSSFRKIT